MSTNEPPTKKARVEGEGEVKQEKRTGIPTVTNYFVLGDVVWVRPAKLPYWPAEVVEVVSASLFRCRLFVPPAVMPPQPKNDKKKEKKAKKQPKETKEVEKESPNQLPTQPGDVIVEAQGSQMYFFDRLRSQHEIAENAAERLYSDKRDYSAYESNFHKAVAEANDLVRIVLNPDTLCKNPNPTSSGLNFLPPAAVVAMPVGVVHSFFRTHTDAPRQPHVPGVTPKAGVIIVRTGLENALQDLKGFEWVWVVFHFSYSAGPGQQLAELGLGDAGETDAPEAGQKTTRDGAPVCSTKKPKTRVVPPRDTQTRGVFATRSPHRPNNIGLSCCRLLDVRNGEVHITDHDLLHGTPILDIKPYLPFCDSHPNAKAGWVDELDASGKSLGDHRRSGDFVVHRSNPPQAAASPAVAGM